MTGKKVLLTGQPGVGKTTLVKKVVDILKVQRHVPVFGFVTEEIRQSGQRIGFDVVTLADQCQRGPLARKNELVSMTMQRRSPRVGQYSVDLSSFENIALPSISSQVTDGILVIDEIGKMELLSKSFTTKVRRLFDENESGILATIPIARGGKALSLVDEITKRSDTMVVTVTRENRDSLVEQLIVQLITNDTNNENANDSEI